MEVQGIGKAARDPDEYLKVCYAHTQRSLPLKKKIIWAIGRCRDQSLAPPLLVDLSHTDSGIRQSAYEALSLLRLSKEPIPLFNAKSTSGSRELAITQIQDWYADARDNS